MYELELLVFLASGFFTLLFLKRWRSALSSAWPPERHRTAKWVLGALPVLTGLLTLATQRTLASYDVKTSFFYTLFYVLLGFAWQYFGVYLLARVLDLSWQDDILHLGNPAALAAFCGGFLGLNLIYNGATTGDGPGWWCVLFAGALGLAAWLLLGLLIHALTRVMERITVDRDTGAGLRFGGYLLGSGLILARASGGDWTSFSRTFVEFLDGWPVLVLALVFVLVEVCFLLDAKAAPQLAAGGGRPGISAVLAAAYLAAAVLAVFLLPPFPQNPLYPPYFP